MGQRRTNAGISIAASPRSTDWGIVSEPAITSLAADPSSDQECPMATYEKLPPHLRERVDKAAADVAALRGVSVSRAREAVLASFQTTAVNAAHGTGH